VRDRVIKAFLVLHPKSDAALRDQLRQVLRIGEMDILLSRANTGQNCSTQLKPWLDQSPPTTELVIVAETNSIFAKNPDFCLLGMLSQRYLLRYWTVDTKNQESVEKVLRKAALVRLSNLEIFNRGLRITRKYSTERLKKGDNCF